MFHWVKGIFFYKRVQTQSLAHGVSLLSTTPGSVFDMEPLFGDERPGELPLPSVRVWSTLSSWCFPSSHVAGGRSERSFSPLGRFPPGLGVEESMRILVKLSR